MDKGRIVQFAPPIEIYRRPATPFVANFVGNPPMNLLPVEAMIEFGRLYIRGEGLHIQALPVPKAAGTLGGKVTVGVRPEHLAIGEAESQHHRRGALRQREHGAREARDPRARRRHPASARIFTDETIALGERVTLSFETRHIRLFDADGKRIAPDDEDA